MVIDFNAKTFIPKQLIREWGPKKAASLCIFVQNPDWLEKSDFSFLKKSELISKVKLSVNEIKDVVITGSWKYPRKVCEWCDSIVAVLHEHHFPVQLKDGGDQIVNICPNCHTTFHSLQENYYEVNDIDKLKEYFPPEEIKKFFKNEN